MTPSFQHGFMTTVLVLVVLWPLVLLLPTFREKSTNDRNDEAETNDSPTEDDQELPRVDKADQDTSAPPRRKEGRKRHGARNQNRHKSFAIWLQRTFPKSFQESSASNNRNIQKSHILDVAGGGKGELAARLCMCLCVNVVVVDPRPAQIVQSYETLVLPKIPNKWQQRVLEQRQRNPNFVKDIIHQRFRQLETTVDERTLQSSQELQNAIQNASLLIGLHADGATEAIVDAALQYGKPFVVVPCCVFPNLFPQRMVIVADVYDTSANESSDDKQNSNRTMRGQVPVRSHDQFCQYLVQKHPEFCMKLLPFEGRNTAIWWAGASPQSPEFR